MSVCVLLLVVMMMVMMMMSVCENVNERRVL